MFILIYLELFVSKRNSKNISILGYTELFFEKETGKVSSYQYI